MENKKNEVAKQTKFIWSAKLGEKGQLVIPKEARDLFNLKKGDSLLLFGDLERGIAIAKQEDYLEFAKKIFEAGKND